MKGVTIYLVKHSGCNFSQRTAFSKL